MQIHPEFDVDTKTWFWEGYEAKTLPELCHKVGEETTVKDYYPKGYKTSKLVTIKVEKVRPSVLATTKMCVVTLGKPQPVTAPPPPPKPRQPRKPAVRVADRLWSDEVEILCDGIKLGISASKVAMKLGRTKNSVMGRAKRTGLRFNGVKRW